MTDLAAAARTVATCRLSIVPVGGAFYAYAGHTLVGIFTSHSRAVEALARWA